MQFDIPCIHLKIAIILKIHSVSGHNRGNHIYFFEIIFHPFSKSNKGVDFNISNNIIQENSLGLKMTISLLFFLKGSNKAPWGKYLQKNRNKNLKEELEYCNLVKPNEFIWFSF